MGVCALDSSRRRRNVFSLAQREVARLFFYSKTIRLWFDICMSDDLFLLLQMQKICLLVRQLGEVFKSGSNVNLVHSQG